jgi:hypothetical protein
VTVEAFVEAELRSGDAVCWWLEVRDDSMAYVIECRIFVQRGDYQDTLWERADVSVDSAVAFQRELAAAVTDLTSNTASYVSVAAKPGDSS